MWIALIRGFHLLLAGLVFGTGIGVVIAAGAIYAGLRDDFASADAIVNHVYTLLSSLRATSVLALLASSIAQVLRTRRGMIWARIGLVGIIVAIQGVVSLRLEPRLRDLRPAVVTDRANQADPGSTNQPTTQAATSGASSDAERTTYLQSRGFLFKLILAQSLLAAVLLVAEGFADVRTKEQIARAWKDALNASSDDGD
jgi:hypothetical protein